MTALLVAAALIATAVVTLRTAAHLADRDACMFANTTHQETDHA